MVHARRYLIHTLYTIDGQTHSHFARYRLIEYVYLYGAIMQQQAPVESEYRVTALFFD